MHIEAEKATQTNTIWMSCDSATTKLNDLFDDGQSKSDAFMIYLCSSLELAKSREKFWEILLSDSSTCVSYLNDKSFTLSIVAEFHRYLSLFGELERIFDKFDEDLLESSFVTY